MTQTTENIGQMPDEEFLGVINETEIVQEETANEMRKLIAESIKKYQISDQEFIHCSSLEN